MKKAQNIFFQNQIFQSRKSIAQLSIIWGTLIRWNIKYLSCFTLNFNETITFYMTWNLNNKLISESVIKLITHFQVYICSLEWNLTCGWTWEFCSCFMHSIMEWWQGIWQRFVLRKWHQGLDITNLKAFLPGRHSL